ncbi:MAG TPA: aspartate kinase, partial [Pricia sp.]|nr:aspartate kinase [Pricia sp.]
MRIFKFGGASVKDAEGVKNVVEVLRQTGHDNTLLVVSAMGKTTNAMEAVVN